MGHGQAAKAAVTVLFPREVGQGRTVGFASSLGHGGICETADDS